MNSALAAMLGLTLSIILIINKQIGILKMKIKSK